MDKLGNDLKAWLNSLKKLPADTIDIVAIDHYPETWSYMLRGSRDWSPPNAIMRIADQYNKKPAIMETSYP